MKVAGEFELKAIGVSMTLGDEFGVYFVGEENPSHKKRQLAFAFDSAKKAIFSAKKISKELSVQYNIETEIEVAALNEEKKKTEIVTIEITGDSKMKKAGNVRKVCKEQLEAGKSQHEALADLIQTYKDLGKDDTYADSRARIVLVSVLKKMDQPVEEGIKKTRKKVAKAETPAAPEAQEGVVENTEANTPEAPEEAEAQEATAEATPDSEVATEEPTETEVVG